MLAQNDTVDAIDVVEDDQPAVQPAGDRAGQRQGIAPYDQVEITRGALEQTVTQPTSDDIDSFVAGTGTKVAKDLFHGEFLNR
jgi:hypothetical protein